MWIINLTGDTLEKYKREYKPPYEFIATATELEFYEYILKSADQFKKQEGIN